MKKDLNISILFGVFSTSILLWLYLYSIIVDVTTIHPTDSSLLYMMFAHSLTSICVTFSFVSLIDVCFKIALTKKEYKMQRGFRRVSKYCMNSLMISWGPMLIFSITALVFKDLFNDSEFFELKGGFIIGFIIVILIIIFALRIRLVLLFKKLGLRFLAIVFAMIITHLFVVSFYAADVRFDIEKDFYRSDEIVRFSVFRKGYVFLPYIRQVNYNFHYKVEQSSDYSYNLDLSVDSKSRSSVLEIEFEPQLFGGVKKKYFYINKSNQ